MRYPRTRHFYGASHPYGVLATSIDTGHRIRNIYQFDTSAERDAWVARGGDHRHSNDWREPVASRSIASYERRRMSDADGFPLMMEKNS